MDEDVLPPPFRWALLILAVGLVGYITALMLIVLALSPSLPLWIVTATVPFLVGWREARTRDSNWRVKAFAGGFAISVLVTSMALHVLVSEVSAMRFLLANLFFTGTEAALAVGCGFALATTWANRTA